MSWEYFNIYYYIQYNTSLSDILALFKMGRILKDHFILSREKLIANYKHSSLCKHPLNIGYPRENFINYFLKNNLPASICFGEGEIIDKDDKQSGQIDIIIQSNNSPRIKISNNLNIFFADHIIACLEIKSDLNKTHLTKSFNNSNIVKSLKRDRKLKNDIREKKCMADLSTIPYLLICYKGLSPKGILKAINSNITLKFPDLIVNIDKHFALIKNNGWLLPKNPDKNVMYIQKNGEETLLYIYQYLFLLIEAEATDQFQGFMDINAYLN